MEASDVTNAMSAAMAIASGLGLRVDDAIVLHNSNKLTLRLLPCDVVARVAPIAHQLAQFEIELAQRLAGTSAPTAGLDLRVEQRVYERDGFVVSLWNYCEQVTPPEHAPALYAHALEQMHAGMRRLDFIAPHFTDRVVEAQAIVTNREQSPTLTEPDRELLTNTLTITTRTIIDSGAFQQLLHGEPHPGNVLNTTNGMLFIDLETACRGPVEFDLAHVPKAVSERYANADQDLVGECRKLVLAMVAAWRWDRDDEFPDGAREGRNFVKALRDGPPWPSLDAVMAVNH